MLRSQPESSSLTGMFPSTRARLRSKLIRQHPRPLLTSLLWQLHLFYAFPHCGGQADLLKGGWVLWYIACLAKPGGDTSNPSLSRQAPAARSQGVPHHYPLQMVMDLCQQSLSSVIGHIQYSYGYWLKKDAVFTISTCDISLGILTSSILH